MSAPELRSFVRTVFDGLDDDQRTAITESLVARATQGHAGWKPSRPSARVVDEACVFADAARRIAYADPDEVSDYLRRGTRAFLAGDHASARAVFEALLLPVAQGDISLGQHEMVEEVLNVDLQVTVAQYVTSVYTTTPLGGRANAVYSAITDVEGVVSLVNPIGDMEGVSAGALPDLGPFIPRWVKRLERVRPAKDDWDTAPERWLREAVFRMEGVEGLERIARKTKRPQACLAWCEVLAERGDWPAALRAYDDAARLVRESHWRGELLDGAALAAQELGRPDLSKRLEAAWRAGPSLTRLLRWLAVDGHEQEAIRTKATRAVARCPKTAGRQVGLLRLLVGEVTGAAAVLSKCPGLGWSNPDHPGHTMFPLLAMLLSNGTIGEALVTELEATARDPLNSFAPTEEEEYKPKLATPSIVALIQGARPGIALTEPDQDAAIDAMRIAAEKRTEGILNNSRRQHYGHAALLVASCVAFAPKSRASELLKWARDLRQRYSRRHAFRQELARACESLDVSMPA
jgi:hypothetical protein